VIMRRHGPIMAQPDGGRRDRRSTRPRERFSGPRGGRILDGHADQAVGGL
jgi:hypothetical protein